MTRSNSFTLQYKTRHGHSPVLTWCIILTIISGSFKAAEAQPGFLPLSDSTWYISGKVIDQSNGNGLFQAHIINLSLNRATLSDRFGYFHIEASPRDTLYFSYVGYKKKLYYLNLLTRDTGFLITIPMYQDTIMLKQFRLLAATRQVQFRNDFISRKFVPDTLNPAFEAFVKENHFSALNTSGIVLPGPFTLIYENFNKGARLKRRIERNRSQYYENLPEEEKQKVLFFEE